MGSGEALLTDGLQSHRLAAYLLIPRARGCKALRQRHGIVRHARNGTIEQTTNRSTSCYTEPSTTRWADMSIIDGRA